MKSRAHRVVRARHLEGGFTAVEIITVMLIVMTIASVALIQLQPIIQQFRANAAMDQVKGALRQARELSISQRRTIVVQFVNNNTIQLFQVVEPGNVRAAQAFLVLPIESTVQFMTFAAEPDTPDLYGIPAAPAGVEFAGVVGGPPVGMQFQSDGTFTDANGTPINGTVFLGVTNVPTTARAITVLGGTGRIHTYRGTGVFWFQ